jgi:hypothetical protein
LVVEPWTVWIDENRSLPPTPLGCGASFQNRGTHRFLLALMLRFISHGFEKP